MNKRTAKEFWNDVEDALDDYFEDYDCFWDTKTYMTTNPYNDNDGAEIDIKIDYDEVPDDIDDVFCEIEDAVDNCGWEYSADWNGNVYEVVLWDD